MVAYGDRLARFGLETLRRVFSAFGTEVEVVNREERTPREELVEDMIAIVSHFAGRLYGTRSRKYREVVDGVKELVG